MVASLAAAAWPSIAGAEEAPAISLNVPKMPEAEWAREVEALLKLVDPQVLYRRVPVPAEKNAWPLWKRAGEVFVQPLDDEVLYEGLGKFLTDETDLADDLRKRVVDWVGQNEACRKLVDEGIARGEIEYPRSARSVRLELAMDEMQIMRNLGRLKSAHVRVLANQGELAAAFDEAASIIEMGGMLIRSECLVVDFLVALAVLNFGAQAAYQTALAPTVTDEQVRAAMEMLAKSKVTAKEFQRTQRIEFCRWFLPLVAGLPRSAGHEKLAASYVAGEWIQGSKLSERELREYQRSIRDVAALLKEHPNPLDKAATIRLGSQLLVRRFAESDKPWITRNPQLVNATDDELSAWPAEVEPDPLVNLNTEGKREPPRKLSERELAHARDALRKVDNVLGKRLVQEPNDSTFSYDVVERNAARTDATRLKLAMRHYEKKHGQLPPRLDDLVAAKLLPEVPQDPYDGGAFKYSRERRVLWCVGREGTNDGVLPDGFILEGVHLTWRIGKL